MAYFEVALIGQARSGRTVEVCRSFAYKLNHANHGGLAYESTDFFASRKMLVPVEDADTTSQQLYEECMAEVRASVATFIAEMKRKRAAHAERPIERTA